MVLVLLTNEKQRFVGGPWRVGRRADTFSKCWRGHHAMISRHGLTSPFAGRWGFMADGQRSWQAWDSPRAAAEAAFDVLAVQPGPQQRRLPPQDP